MCGGGVSLHLCAVGIGSAPVHLPGASVIETEPTETEAEAQANAEAEAEEGGVHEADMDEPEGAEPTAEEYNAFFDAIMAMP